MKKFIALLLALVLVLGLLAGCTGPEDPKYNDEGDVSGGENSGEPEGEENYETGDASLDDPRNQDDIGENELLVVSFGTSYNDSRRLTIGAIEEELEKAFPDYAVRRAFTSQIIIDHVYSRDGEVIDNFEQAMDRAVSNGVKNIVIQPTHLMDGLEYADVVASAAQYADAFESMVIAKNLLSEDADFEKVARIMYEDTAAYDDGKTAVVFMGHGTEAESNAVYSKLQNVFGELGYSNHYIGTVEASPSLDDVLAAIKDKGYERVVLQALMIVCGDHANNDMAGDDPESWKSVISGEGYEVECVLKGLGEIEGIRELIVEHCREAIGTL